MKIQDPVTIARDAVSARADRPATAMVHDSPDARIIVFRIGPGQQVAPHTSASTVILQVVSGAGTVTGAEGDRAVRMGDVVTYAPNERHGMRAGSETFVVLAVIAPRPAATG